MKKIISLILLTAVLFSLAACGGKTESTAIPSSNDAVTVDNSKKIVLNGDSIESETGAAVNGSTVTIAAAGNYAISGTLTNGKIVINTGDDAGKVNIILNGADITNLDGSAIVVEKASKVNIYLENGTKNRVVSGTPDMMGSADEDASGAAISAKDDIDFKGSGSLEVFGYINNGIACKNDIDIEGGNITVSAANNAIRGTDSVEVKGGNLMVTAGNDGIKSLTTDKEGKGRIVISGGNVSVNAAGDGIAAATTLEISGGNINVATSGDADKVSCKGLKANSGITVSGGALAVESSDNAVHCAGEIVFSGGSMALISEKVGIRGKETGSLSITGGEIFINSAKKCFEVDNGMSYTGGEMLAIGYYKNGSPELCEGLIAVENDSLASRAVFKYNTIIIGA